MNNNLFYLSDQLPKPKYQSESPKNKSGDAAAFRLPPINQNKKTKMKIN